MPSDALDTKHVYEQRRFVRRHAETSDYFVWRRDGKVSQNFYFIIFILLHILQIRTSCYTDTHPQQRMKMKQRQIGEYSREMQGMHT